MRDANQGEGEGWLEDGDEALAFRDRIRLALSPGAWRVVVAACAAAIIGAWWLTSRHGQEPLPVAVAPSLSATQQAAAETAAPGARSGPARGLGSQPVGASLGTITVDVVGPVRRPGVVSLPPGSRVVDALAAAGGLTAQRRGRLLRLNLARFLVDGEQIDARGRVPGADAETRATLNATGGTASGVKVDLNKAGLAELDALPRVGPVTAQKIINFRNERGGFRSVDQLKEVAGIGDRTFEELAQLVRV